MPRLPARHLVDADALAGVELGAAGVGDDADLVADGRDAEDVAAVFGAADEDHVTGPHPRHQREDHDSTVRKAALAPASNARTADERLPMTLPSVVLDPVVSGHPESSMSSTSAPRSFSIAMRIRVLAVPSGISSRSAISAAVHPQTPASTTARRWASGRV